MILEWAVDHIEPQMIKQFLKEKGISRSFLAHVKAHGDILVNGKHAIVIDLLHSGDHLALVIPDEEGHETTVPSYIPIDVLYEDDLLLVVNKPQGTASIPSILHPDQSMANRVKGYYLKNGYRDLVVHVVTRLDKDTTGVMLFAKNRVAHAWMDQQLRSKTLKKRYQAIVQTSEKLVQHEVIDQPIGRVEGSIIQRGVVAEGKPSLTEYWIKEQQSDWALIDIQLHTGRTHQIRVHFAHLGCPLWGDDLYGGRIEEPLTRQALHCYQIEFIQPMTGRLIQIEAPLAEDMQEWIAKKKIEEEVRA